MNELSYLEKAGAGRIDNINNNSHTLSLSPPPVNIDLLGADVREYVKGMKLATGELVNNKQNKKLKV